MRAFTRAIAPVMNVPLLGTTRRPASPVARGVGAGLADLAAMRRAAEHLLGAHDCRLARRLAVAILCGGAPGRMATGAPQAGAGVELGGRSRLRERLSPRDGSPRGGNAPARRERRASRRDGCGARLARPGAIRGARSGARAHPGRGEGDGRQGAGPEGTTTLPRARGLQRPGHRGVGSQNQLRSSMEGVG